MENNEKILEFLLENPNAKIYDNEGNHYVLVENQVIKRPPTYFNTWEHIEFWQNKLLKESENYPVLDGLEQSWQLLEQDYNFEFENLVDRKNRNAETPLKEFLYCIDMGFYPPPEVLLAIVDIFEHYLRSEGNLSLEDVFFGKTEKGIGNYAARKSRNDVLFYLGFCISLNHEGKSQLEIAEEVVNHLKLKDEPESLLRQYRRFKKKQENIKSDK